MSENFFEVRLNVKGMEKNEEFKMEESSEMEIDLGRRKRDAESSFDVPKMHSNIISMVERVENEPEMQYVWSAIMRGTFGYIYGPAKSGKTILAENLAMSIAAKIPMFLGMPIDSTGIENVLFISLEEFWVNRTQRNRKQLSVLQGINIDNFGYNVVDESFPLTMEFEDDWNKMSRTITGSGAQFVVIDSFTRLTWDEVEKSKVGSVLSRRLKDITTELGITMVVIHHSSKITDSNLDLANMAGSRVIGQEADFILGVNRLSNGTRYFKEVATRYKQEDEYVTTFTIDDNLWLEDRLVTTESSLFGTVDHRENPANEQLVLNTIKQLAKNSNEVKTCEVIVNLSSEIGKTTAYGYLKNLEEKGLIDRSKNGFLNVK